MKVTTLGLKWPSRESIQANNAVPPTGFTGHPWAPPVILNRETKSANMVTVRHTVPHTHPPPLSKKKGSKRGSIAGFSRSSKNSIHFVLNLARNAARIYDPAEGPTPAWNHLSRRDREGGGARNARKLNSWRKYRWNEPTNNPSSLPSLLSKSCIQSSVSPWFIRATTVKENVQRSLPLPSSSPPSPRSVFPVARGSRGFERVFRRKNVEFPAIVPRVNRD